MDLCYSDIQTLWSSRALFDHVFPYLHGGLTGGYLPPGFIEYPVLGGVIVYLLALPASTDFAFFNLSAVALAACGAGTAYLLARFCGRRALWFALAPALVLYSFLNWDLMVVLATVGALVCVRKAALAQHGTGRDGRWLAAAAALLAAGGALKFYPLMFVLPVALWLAFGGAGRAGAPASARWRTALLFAATAGGVFILINVPFLVLDYRGWAAVYHFQWSRPIDFTTNSIWYWGSRPRDVNDPALQRMLSTDSTLATAAGLVLAAGAGVLLRRRFGAYPWLQVCAAMLCLYLLLNKVHSPQYMLWLLPFFVLLRIRWGWIVAYSVVDACIGVGAMLMFSQGLDIGSGAAAQLVMIGVWGRAALLPVLAVAFLAAVPAWTVPAVGRKMPGTPPELSAPAQRKIEVLAG